MKKLFTLATLTILFVGSSIAQRYLTPQFTDVKVTKNVTFGENFTYSSLFTQKAAMLMDVYEPDGDVETNRPVVILGHGGSYLPLYPWGKKEQYSVVEMCTRLAKLGYVAVSIDYRLGWEAGSPNAEVREKTIINAVYMAMQDFKTAVRYFRKNYAEDNNQWGIDPCKIFVGGTNSGGYSALAVSNMNKPDELLGIKFLDSNGDPYVDQSKTGNFDGFGGTKNFDNFPGYNSIPAAVIAMGAATGDTAWTEPGEIPVIAFHGTDETNTPYNTAIVLTSSGANIIVVSGAGDYMPRVERLGNNDVFKNASLTPGPANKDGNGNITQPVEGLYPFHGARFEPWSWYDNAQEIGDPALNPTASKTKAMLYIDTIMSYTAPRLNAIIEANQTCEVSTSIRNVNTNDVSFTLVPNPATSTLTIFASNTNENIASVNLIDLSGKVVLNHQNESGYYAVLNVEAISNGIYIAEMLTESGVKDLRKVVIQH